MDFSKVRKMSIPVLPSEYKQLNYINTKGTEYIKTGKKMAWNTRIIASFKFTSNTDVEDIIGVLTTNNGCYIQKQATTKKVVLRVGGVSALVTSTNALDSTSIYTFDANFQSGNITCNIYKNNDFLEKLSLTSSTTPANYELYIGGINQDNVFKVPVSAYVYSYSIYQNGTLVRQLIPAQRRSDNVIGMFDLIANSFLTNASTGTFGAGTETKSNIREIKQNGQTLWKGLPNTFTKLKCIKSTGTQKIDTLIPCEDISKLEIKTLMTVDASSLKAFGAIDEITSSTFKRLHIGVTGGNVYAFGIKSNAISTTISQPSTPARITIDIQNNKYYINNTAYSISATGSYPTSTFTLFGRNSNVSTRMDFMSMAVYYAKFYQNGILIKEFIPAKRNSDSVVGLYDIVNDKFYTNVGTGTFQYE